MKLNMAKAVTSSKYDTPSPTESSQEFGVGSGVLIAVPVPAGAGVVGNEIEQAIQQALIDAK